MLQHKSPVLHHRKSAAFDTVDSHEIGHGIVKRREFGDGLAGDRNSRRGGTTREPGEAKHENRYLKCVCFHNSGGRTALISCRAAAWLPRLGTRPSSWWQCW